MSKTEGWQVSEKAAAIYDSFFVPAIFGAWAPVVARAAGVAAGDRVLDVACGTGVLARHAADLVGEGGHVTGLDINPGMLAVASKAAPDIAWQQGDATNLPFGDGQFNRVVSQFGLMFFPDRVAALREMWRVLAPGGRLAVAAWASVDEAAGYRRLIEIATTHTNAEAASVFAAPFVLGDRGDLMRIAADAGLSAPTLALERGQVRFPSVSEFVRIEVKGSPLSETLDQAAMDRLAHACETALAAYVQSSGELVMPIAAHIVTAARGTDG